MDAIIDGVIIQSELVTWMPWIQVEAVKIAMKCERGDKPTSIEDMKQEGVIALLSKLVFYDTTKAAGLYAFSKRRVVGAMYDYMRNKSRSRRKNPPIFVYIDDYEPGDYREPAYEESKELLYDLDHILFPKDKRQKDIIIAVLYADTQREVGDMFGVDESRISQVMSAFRKMNTDML